MNAAIIGKKIGMTSLFSEDGKHYPCTVVEAGPCPVTMIRTEEKDGYTALQVGFGEAKEQRIGKPLQGQFKKAGIKPAKNLKEFRNLEGEYEVGDMLTVEQFEPGDRVKITGTSIGRGFQGVMKRHNFGGVGMMSHGQSDRQRHPGSIGQSSYPSRVMKGLRMAGQMGNKKASIRNIQVVDVLADRNLIFLKGSVPGKRNSLVYIVK